MEKLSPDKLASETSSISMPEYDWEKQSRTDAYGTYASTNNRSMTRNAPPLGSSWDTSFDSIND